MSNQLKVIAHIKTDFPEKFGIPRQSGLVPTLKGRIVFEPEYSIPEAFRGLEGYSHLWIIWEFSEAKKEGWSPTVRPPRLGGNKRMGVFATRSPYRPNSIGLSSVKIEEIILSGKNGVEIVVSGVDIMDGTPIYDIKPYIAYTDSHPEALGGFSTEVFKNCLKVHLDGAEASRLEDDLRERLISLLEGDMRPSYQNDPERIYRFEFSGLSVAFRVEDDQLYVISIK